MYKAQTTMTAIKSKHAHLPFIKIEAKVNDGKRV